MASDNSPKERQKNQLERKLGRRESYDRILIVSEGSKTEPIQVVKYARELFENGDRHRSIQRRAFEKVYAVFEPDDHKSYHEALAQATLLNGSLKNDAKQLISFQAIASVPSFELWLLLHFEDIQAPLHRDEVMRRLKTHIQGYDKGASNAFAILLVPNLVFAPFFWKT